MLFSSISFLYYFLPVVLLVYFLVPFKLKNYWLLLASLFFYFWGEQEYTLLLLFSCGLNYTLGLYIGRHQGTRASKRGVILAIALSLSLLIFFKYADFFIGIFNSLTGGALPLLRISLPLGISFYTFQIMSYTIDVYNGKANIQKNPFIFATYVSLFPQLVAGPIVRYATVEKELFHRKHSLDDFAAGASRFIIGLAKKVLLANQLGELQKIALTPADNSVLLSWVNVIAFSLQIYFDFSGYSDMAIGLGRIFGFHFLENFNYPFISKSISEFWRRWHISLGTWFREYLYIPLGGSRVSNPKWLRNLFIVWFCTGFWHGASWNFIFWGLFFGVVLGMEKIVLNRYLEKCPAVVRHFYVLFLVIMSFVIFQNETITQIGFQLKNMWGYGGLPLSGAETAYILKSFAVLLMAALIGSTPFPKKLGYFLCARFPSIAAIAQPVLVACLLLLCTGYLIDSSFNPFLYFRF